MNNPRLEKAAIILRIVFLLLCTVGVSLAWFNRKEYAGGSIEYQKKLQITSVGGNVTNYIGTASGESGSEIQYTKLERGFDVVWQEGQALSKTPSEGVGGFTAKNLYPGARLYFKTEVENKEKNPVDVAIFLTNINYSKPLNRAIYFVEVQPAAFSYCYAEEAEEVIPQGEGERYYHLTSARTTRNFNVPAATEQDGQTIPGKQSIYWYIEINGEEAGNDCANAWLTISQMQLVTGS